MLFSDEYCFDYSFDNSFDNSENPLRTMISSETLFDNIERHPTTGKYICDICDNEYASYSGLYSHKRKHDPSYIPKFSCSLCDYSHDNNKHLLDHIEVHAKRNEVATIITNQRTLYRKSSIYKKAYNPESGDFTCAICSKKYLYRQSLQVHIKEHLPNRLFRFNCELCDFKTDHKAHFGRHTKSHKSYEQ
jgi:KRAB domain-containing zinc finger protein